MKVLAVVVFDVLRWTAGILFLAPQVQQVLTFNIVVCDECWASNEEG